MNGAASNPCAHIFAYAAAQVKKGLEVAKKLGAVNFGKSLSANVFSIDIYFCVKRNINFKSYQLIIFLWKYYFFTITR